MQDLHGQLGLCFGDHAADPDRRRRTHVDVDVGVVGIVPGRSIS